MKTFKEFLWALVHFGPIATMLLIKTITLATIYTSLMWWPIHNGIGGLLNLTSFMISSGMVMFNFFSAISNGPGYLPFGWTPSEAQDVKKLQFCTVCKGYKAPRAHHCRKCGRCVLKLEHHCPWINGCVGHRNHAYFVFFLLSAVVGCTHACVILGCSLYRAIYWNYYVYHEMTDVPLVYLGVYGFLWVMFSLGCSVGVSLGVSVLLYYQMRVVLRNQTTIEDWIIEKAEYRRKHYPDLSPLIFPYDLGWRRNFALVLNLSCEPIGDGISWPVKENCTQYTLTMEQLEQKNEKKMRAKDYSIIEDYGGSWCPISKGVGVFCHPPCSDETRLPLKKGDQINVTRWKKYWLYGQKMNERTGEPILPQNGVDKVKGWFPRKVAVQIVNHNQYENYPSEDEPEEVENKEIGGGKKKKNN